MVWQKQIKSEESNVACTKCRKVIEWVNAKWRMILSSKGFTSVQDSVKDLRTQKQGSYILKWRKTSSFINSSCLQSLQAIMKASKITYENSLHWLCLAEMLTRPYLLSLPQLPVLRQYQSAQTPRYSFQMQFLLWQPSNLTPVLVTLGICSTIMCTHHILVL